MFIEPVINPSCQGSRSCLGSQRSLRDSSISVKSPLLSPAFPPNANRMQLEGHGSWLRFYVLPQLATFHSHVGESSVKVWRWGAVLRLVGGKTPPSKVKRTNSPPESPKLMLPERNVHLPWWPVLPTRSKRVGKSVRGPVWNKRSGSSVEIGSHP